MKYWSTLQVTVMGWLLLAVGPDVAAASPDSSAAGTAVEAQGGLDAALGGALITAVLGGLVLLVGRSYAESATGKARSEPGRSFLVGFLALLAVIGFFVFGMVTRIFLILAFPLLVGFALVAFFGAIIAYLAIGRAVSDGWVGPLLVAVVVGALIAGTPVLGGIVGFVVGSIGTGAVINHYRDGDGASGQPRGRTVPSGEVYR